MIYLRLPAATGTLTIPPQCKQGRAMEGYVNAVAITIIIEAGVKP